ncbi:glutathione S-transferase/RNA polymerase-associated protein [Altererythrobacter xiamenensis]|uniref:Glutathione S-transferase/RNA polymerase-associated protein n=1 Tax=Altererythrobacter xiamenensis TaxID=1316679 RepID=A0A1Y6EP37_9SPHN|nr:glutathione S-transferase family protein [Altererythrobacter xiamenensis]SMQ64424.1 glutathione S-transferase/RNA polymerase-associated protein [Altererythrobacter xiamenensis]
MLILYDHPLSPYAQKVKIALDEKGVGYETRVPDGIGIGGAQGDFVEASPRLEVPALIDGDTRLFESTIILEYIEEKWPEPALLPRGPAQRARHRTIEDVLDTQFEAIVWGLGELKWFKRADGELAEAMQSAAKDQIDGYYRWLEKQLGEDRWFGGDEFGWADMCTAPYVNGAAGFGYTPAEGSRLAAWLDRANARPSVNSASTAAQEVLSGMEQVAGAVEAGIFKREYRDHRLEWMVKSGGLDIVVQGLARDNIRFTPLPG